MNNKTLIKETHSIIRRRQFGICIRPPEIIDENGKKLKNNWAEGGGGS